MDSMVDTGSLEEYRPPIQATDGLENDLMAEAEEFKSKGDTFYMGNKFEQAYKAYSIAIDCLTLHVANDGKKSKKIVELKLQILMSMAEASY